MEEITIASRAKTTVVPSTKGTGRSQNSEERKGTRVEAIERSYELRHALNVCVTAIHHGSGRSAKVGVPQRRMRAGEG